MRRLGKDFDKETDADRCTMPQEGERIGTR